MLTSGSLFSGIGGFDYGFEQAGIRTRWQVERDLYCRRILERRFPSARRHVDVTGCGIANLAPVDIITAGVPCQDVSVAGARRGLEGKRTGLFFEFARILFELRPRWFVFENVPGLFVTHAGRDFAEVVRVLMAECGYGLSWRVLDSQFFGVAQRRRRLYIVGHLGKPCPAEILFDAEGGEWNSATRGKTGESIAAPLTSGSHESKPARRLEDDYNIVASTITAEYSEQCYRGDATENLVAPALTSRMHKGAFTDPVNDGIIAFDPTQITSAENRSDPQPGDPCHPLAATAYAPVVAETLGSLNGSGGFRTTDLDGPGAYVCTPADPDRVRDFAGLPEGMDSPRYRALGNAVTTQVARWIAERIVRYGG